MNKQKNYIIVFWSVMVMLPSLFNALHYVVHHHDFDGLHREGYWIQESHAHHLCPDAWFKIQPHFQTFFVEFPIHSTPFVYNYFDFQSNYLANKIHTFYLRGPPI